MNVYTCNYHWYGGRGAYEDIYTLVIAETESVALGLVLEKYTHTMAKDWTVLEIDTSIRDVYEISQRTN